MEIDMQFNAHIADTVGCAQEAQDVIRRTRASIRIQLKRLLNDICEATERGCSSGTGLSDKDARNILACLDEDLDNVLADAMSDLEERAQGEG
jgi:hypothetical protein